MENLFGMRETEILRGAQTRVRNGHFTAQHDKTNYNHSFQYNEIIERKRARERGVRERERTIKKKKKSISRSMANKRNSNQVRRHMHLEFVLRSLNCCSRQLISILLEENAKLSHLTI